VSLSSPFIERPVMTSLVMAALLFFGLGAYFILPTSDLPAVDFPTIQVSASYSGASPETMASSVAAPLEREFASIAGLSSMSSSNSLGSTSITLQFDLDRNIDGAALDVQAAITRANANLPDDLTDPPTFQKVNPADAPILYIALSSPTLPIYTINDYAKTYLAETISMIPGVAQVLIYGEKKYSPRIRLDPMALASRSISLDEVRQAVSEQNVNLPLGSLESSTRTLTLMAKGQLMNAAEYRKVVVTYRDGQPVYLEDLAQVDDSVEHERFGAFHNNRPDILLAVKRQPGSNTIAVVDAIRAKLPIIQKQLPASLAVDVMYDRSEFIRDSVADVKFTLALAVGLVILVVFAFLRSLAGTFIAGVAIPFSIIATFSAMYLLNFTLDNLSLMALTLSVGFVVDDAIVMLENVFRHVEQGKSPLRAAFDGAAEIGFTILSMTLALAVVFVPILFMPGVLGRILREFAVTITVAILISGVVAVSLSPMLCAKVLRKDTKISESGRFFSWLLEGYRRSLRLALDHRGKTLILAGLMLLATGALFAYVPKGFLPPNDVDLLIGYTQARQGISYPAMAGLQRSLSPRLAADPDVESESQVISYPLENQGLVIVILKPQTERKSTADQVLARLRPKLNSEPGLVTYLVNPPLIPIGGKSARGDYMLTLQCPDTALLYKAAQKLEKVLMAEPTLSGVNSDLLLADPQVHLDIDREKAARLGISVRSIEDALYSSYAERGISNIYGSEDVYKVVMELKPEFQRNEKALTLLYLRSAAGDLVRLDALAELRSELGPATVNHTGQLTSVTYSFSAAPGVSLGAATETVERLASANLPGEVAHFMEGTASAFQESLGGMAILLVITLFLIYVLLGCLYESYAHPLTILSGLPSAALGGLLTLLLFGQDLNLYGYVGIIMLIGIVKKNSIMVVDFAIQAEKSGKTPEEAAFEGSLVRFRPIMMTTIAAIMGALPIALGFGAGAEARRPMGLVVVGGLILSQVVTLYLTPVVYTYMDRLQHRKPGAEAAPEA